MTFTRILILFTILVLLVLSNGLFVVDETQQVVITRFGKPQGEAILAPGVHFKWPFVDRSHFFDKRFLEWDGASDQATTADKRFIWVDTFARWRIADPKLFLERLSDERAAQTRLDDIIDGATKRSVAQHDLVELVRSSNRTVQPDLTLPESERLSELTQITSGRQEIMQEILQNSAEGARDLGIEVIDVRFKSIDYVDEVRQNVYARMVAERQRIAARFLSEGQGESARIIGEKERELKAIQSEAYRQSQELIGKADGEATTIYAKAYNRDPEFYKFLKTMETYEQTMDKESTVILSTESDFFKFLNNIRGR
jgi:membrane protease subunit HflC